MPSWREAASADIMSLTSLMPAILAYTLSMGLGDEKYVVITTFRKSGVEVATPTWITPLSDGRVGFWTSSQSGKAKRLRKNPKLTVQPGNARGAVKPGTAPVEATATLLTEGADFDAVQRQITAKYGFMVRLSKLGNTLGHLGKKFPYGDVAVVFKPAPPA
jgi:PPOX class probable F420-dependent enzyme